MSCITQTNNDNLELLPTMTITGLNISSNCIYMYLTFSFTLPVDLVLTDTVFSVFTCPTYLGVHIY